MKLTTITSRELDRETGRAKRKAANGPVLITDRGQATHVLLTIEDYHWLPGVAKGVVDSLA